MSTRDALGNALIELMTERAFDSITVQQVLDRAGVARSTFYVHYDDKHDLFASDVDEFWEAIANRRTHDDRVLPVRELFEHAGGMRAFQRALRASGKYAEVMEAGKQHFARAIERRLVESPRAKHLSRAAIEPIAIMHAAGVVALLEWWIDHSDRMSAADADELCHRMLWKAIV